MGLGAWIKRGVAAVAPGAAIVSRHPGSGAVAMSFDDGPNPEVTPRLLDALDRLEVRGTFFLVGRQAELHPALVRDIDSRGHQVASHGYAHLDARRFSAPKVVKDAEHAQACLEDILGRTLPRDYRPPFGTVNPAAFVKMAIAGFRHVFWSVDSRDAFCATAQELSDSFSKRTVRAGDVILLHDDYPLTVDAIPSIVDRIRKAGLGFETVAGPIADADQAARPEPARPARGTPTAKRELAARALVQVGGHNALRGLRTVIAPTLRVLAYHRVAVEPLSPDYPFDRELVSSFRSEFEWQLDYLRRHYSPVSCRQVADALDGGAPLPPRPVLVTFDDGFDDNYGVAFPALAARDVPAIIFLATDYVGSEAIYWFDRVAYAIQRTRAERLRFEDGTLLQIGSTPRTRQRALRDVLRQLKSLENLARSRMVDELERIAAAPVEPAHRPLSRALDWAQVREMSERGIEFGSHTASHPVLTRIADPETLDRELIGSKERIEAETGRAVDALAYPVGGIEALNERVVDRVRATGYRLAFTYQSGNNRLDRIERLALKRLRVEHDTTRDWFAAMLEAPELVTYPSR